MVYDRNGLKQYSYWKLQSKPHEDNLEATATKVRELLRDTVERQLVSDVPLGSLLSGGLDSSALTAIAADFYKRTGQPPIQTFSVDYADNHKHFQANDFQPDADAPWIKKVSDYLGAEHKYIEFDTPELVDALQTVVFARDMPGMADVDASLFLFCREIKKDVTVAISGEAADEIFGGYPWFHREESLNAHTFPWALSSKNRTNLLSPELIDMIQPEQYLAGRYEEALNEVPRLQGEEAKASRMREMSYLNITRFMPTLLDRKDRMSMAVGLEVRVPFCDHRLIDYVWNIPWEIKSADNREKGILRRALKGILPADVITRKKSPYPKTHNPNYLAAVKAWVVNILDDPASPILPFINKQHLRDLAESDASSFNTPWFGQLMTGPQLFAYIGQVDTWLKKYQVTVKP
ncbi:MAG TPA: asparagine synthase (glutamine-hydrolyzing), partial [Bacilli bacterium]